MLLQMTAQQGWYAIMLMCALLAKLLGVHAQQVVKTIIPPAKAVAVVVIACDFVTNSCCCLFFAMSHWRVREREFAAAADCELQGQCAQNKCIDVDDGASCTVSGELALTSSLHALQPAHSCLLHILALLHACCLLSCVKPTVHASPCPCVYHYIIRADTATVAGWHGAHQTSSSATCTSPHTFLHVKVVLCALLNKAMLGTAHCGNGFICSTFQSCQIPQGPGGNCYSSGEFQISPKQA